MKKSPNGLARPPTSINRPGNASQNNNSNATTSQLKQTKMSKSQTAQDLLSTQLSPEEQDNLKSRSEATELQQIPMEGTPFTMVMTKQGWIITLGKYRLSEPFPTKPELELWYDDNMITVIFAMSHCVAQEYCNQLEQEFGERYRQEQNSNNQPNQQQ